MIHAFRSPDSLNPLRKGTGDAGGAERLMAGASLPAPSTRRSPAGGDPGLDHIQRIVFAHPDRVLIDVLGRAIMSTLPKAHVECVTTGASLRSSLLARAADLTVVSVDLPGEDEFAVLGALRRPAEGRRLLFVTNRSDYQVVQAMRSVGAQGAIDTTAEDIECFCRALRGVARGQTYWSPTLQRVMQGAGHLIRALRHLTAKEMYLFAILGDGCSDDVAAAMVNLSEQTVHGYRKRLHRKLGIQHKGALVTRAFLYGLVRVTPDGVVRPGLDLLRARCRMPQRPQFGHPTASMA